MAQYVALLRGINVGGNNKVSMTELKACFEKAGLTNVKTYINSGNIIFTSPETDNTTLVGLTERVIKQTFKLPVRVVVISHQQLKQIIAKAPKTWDGGAEYRHNALFIFPPATAKQALAAVGEPKPDLESANAGVGLVYWSSSAKYPGRTTWSRIVSKPIYKQVTIRNYNTTVKLLKLMDEMSKNTN